MFLTKIGMDLTDPVLRAALRDAQRMHRLTAGLYRAPREDAQILYRLCSRGSSVWIYLYAGRPVDPACLTSGMKLVGERDVSDWLLSMEEGQIWNFDLLTMPFRKIADAGGKNSRRRVLRSREERLTWLARKAEQNGFEVLTAEESEEEKLGALHPEEKGGRMHLDTYRYTGALRILDTERFRNAVQKGIGPGKAYGLGMLLLKR